MSNKAERRAEAARLEAEAAAKAKAAEAIEQGVGTEQQQTQPIAEAKPEPKPEFTQAQVKAMIDEALEQQKRNAVIPTQGSLFQTERFLGTVKGFEGTVLKRDRKDAKGNSIIDNETGAIAVESYGVKIAPMTQKKAAEALDLKGKENKPLLEVARLQESDELMRQAKGTVAALPESWTLARMVVKKTRKGVEELTLVSRNVKRTPEYAKYAAAFGVTADELEGVLKELKAKKEAAVRKTIDV